MDPILLIIKYLFKRKNLINNDDSIDTFFENGVSFPQFIALIFNVDEIPNIKKDPKTLFHKKMNDDVALQYLFQKNEFIKKINPSFSNEREKSSLLLLIFTKQCFTININEIIARCNTIVRSLNINYTKKSEIITVNCILSILHVLTDGKVQFNKDLDTNNNFDEIINTSFKQANAPLVINKSSLDLQNQNIFLIQLEILFDFFAEKIQQLDNSPIKSIEIQNKQQNQPHVDDTNQTTIQIDKKSQEQNEKSKLEKEKPVDKDKEKLVDNLKDKEKSVDNDKEKIVDAEKDNHVDGEEEEEEFEDDFNFDDQKVLDDENSYKKIDKKIKKKKKKKKKSTDDSSDSSSIDDDFDKADRLNEALLKTMNVIAKGKLHFNNFHEAVINDSIPIFVMHLLNIQSIENVQLTKSKKSSISSSQKDQKLTKNEIKNIQSVIEFLKSKENAFKFLKFDFENPYTEESSAVLFYSNLLTFFFLKKTKKEIYDRCGTIFSTKDNYSTEDNDEYYEFTQFNLFPALLHFYLEKNLHFKWSELPKKNNEVEELFNKAKIPMIIDKKIMDNTFSNNVSDIIFYQIQFILDAIDSGPKSLYIIETFLKAYHNLEKIEVPKYDLLAASIRAKKTSLEFQKARADQYLNRSSSQNIFESYSSGEIPKIVPKKTINPPKTYEERSKELNKNQRNKQENKNSAEQSMKIESFEKFWNAPNPNFGFDNGIMYEKLQHQHNRIKRQQEWMNEIENIQKSVNKNDKKIPEEEMKAEQSISFKNSQTSFQSKLYKIFHYDEANSNWCFNSDVFEQFSNDKKINVEDSITPITLIVDSFENDSIEMTSNLISGIFPKFDSEGSDDQIFIYGFCDKTLSMLNFKIDFSNKYKASVKPLFLLLHVPKSKENLPNLQSIIFQIYSFLTSISDLQIIILDKDHYLDQIELAKVLKTVYKSVEKLDESNMDSDSYDIDDFLKSSDDEDDSTKKEEEEEDVLEEEEEKIENQTNINSSKDNMNSRQNMKKYLSKITLPKYKTIFLVNDSTIQFNKEIENNLNDNDFYKHILLQFDENEAFIDYINVKDSNTYEAFLRNFNDILINSDSTYYGINKSFQCVDLFKFSPMYVRMKMKPDTWKEDLKKIVLKRYSDFESNQVSKENSFQIISDLKDETTAISPLIDNEFNNEIALIFSNLKSEGSKKNRDLYAKELENGSKLYLDYLKEKINSKFYWTEEQMDLMFNTYVDFMKEEFYNIIKHNSTEQIYNMIYEDNYEILENQIKSDKNKIDIMFKKFIDKINTKKNPKEQDIKEDIKKGANYAMKETENLREIKVTVQINKDLKTEIEQDY